MEEIHYKYFMFKFYREKKFLFEMYSISKRIILALLFLIILENRALSGRDRLVIGITQFPSSFHPNIDAMLAKSYVNAMTSRPFTIYNSEWKLQCMLCLNLPSLRNGLAKTKVLSDGKKGISITFEIHPDATWGDGTPVTTSDVKFTWNVGRHKKSGVANVEFYRSLYDVEEHSSKRFTLHFDKVSFDYNAINSFRLIPAHIDVENFSEPEKYKFRSAFNTDPLNPGLYFGPYRISEIIPGARVVLVPNSTWYGKAPEFKTIVVRVIQNTTALEANLLSGSVDMVAGELGFSVEQAISFERRNGHKYKIIFKPGLIYEHIDLNLDNKILSDVRVRRALLYSIDRDAINKQLFSGRQPTAHSSVNPLDWVHSDKVTRYKYSPAIANKLLNEAGWILGQDGRRYNKNGDPLSLKLMSTSGNRTREMVGQVLKSQWKKVGVDIEIKNQPARVFFGQTVTERKFSSMAMFAWISSPESVPRTTLHSSHIPLPENNFSGQNYTGFKNKVMDGILERLEVELNRDKRKKMWESVQEIYSSELPALPLYFRSNAYVLPKWLKGVKPTGHQGVSTNWIEYWHYESN